MTPPCPSLMKISGSMKNKSAVSCTHLAWQHNMCDTGLVVLTVILAFGIFLAFSALFYSFDYNCNDFTRDNMVGSIIIIIRALSNTILVFQVDPKCKDAKMEELDRLFERRLSKKNQSSIGLIWSLLARGETLLNLTRWRHLFYCVCIAQEHFYLIHFSLSAQSKERAKIFNRFWFKS